jgi:predicted oxidoreductase
MKTDNLPQLALKLSLLVHGVLPGWNRLLTCRVLATDSTKPLSGSVASDIKDAGEVTGFGAFSESHHLKLGIMISNHFYLL